MTWSQLNHPCSDFSSWVPLPIPANACPSLCKITLSSWQTGKKHSSSSLHNCFFFSLWRVRTQRTLKPFINATERQGQERKIFFSSDSNTIPLCEIARKLEIVNGRSFRWEIGIEILNFAINISVSIPAHTAVQFGMMMICFDDKVLTVALRWYEG